MKQKNEKRISSAWRPDFRRKVNFFIKNATKSDFERAPSDISAIPTHPDGSRGPVQYQKHPKKLKMPGFVLFCGWAWPRAVQVRLTKSVTSRKFGLSMSG